MKKYPIFPAKRYYRMLVKYWMICSISRQTPNVSVCMAFTPAKPATLFLFLSLSLFPSQTVPLYLSLSLSLQ